MPKLVLLLNDGQIAEVIEENISSLQFQDMMQDYCRLLKLEKDYESNIAISKSNEQKLHLLFEMLADKGAFKKNRFALYPLLKPYFDDMMNDHELRKKLNNKLIQNLKERNSIFWQQVKTFFWRGFAWSSRYIGKKLTK